MKYIFILNSFGLKNKLNDTKDKIIKAATSEKLDYIIEINSKEISTEDIVEKYKDTKNVIIAVGGDGIINRVLNKLVGTKNILGFIPIGTGNDFYRTCKETLNKTNNKIDLVKINDRYFINVACFGIDADIGNNENIIHNKLIPKNQRYNLGIVRNFIKYKPRNFKITVNNEKIEKTLTTIAICNGRYYGGGHKIGYNSIIDDGMLNIYIVDKMPKIMMASLIMGLNKGKHLKSKYVSIIDSRKISIESNNKIKANIDGEILEDRVFNVEIIKKGIEIYYNQNLINKILGNVEK